MALVASYTEPLNSMVRPDQREFVDRLAEQPGVSRGSVVRRALDLLMDTESGEGETVGPAQ